MEPDPSLSTGRVAGRYTVQERLGRGGMADVHAAYDELLHRRVAIKVLRDSPDTQVAQQRFLAEARILASLSDPGLVKVLDTGVHDGQPFLVMELLPGGTLADLVARGPRPVAEVAAIGAQIASALAHVHDAGVIHRDVKPSNVLLDGEGSVRLTDFGIARLVDDTLRWTSTGTTVGTMTYLAPEQACGEAVTVAADVYSLGLVLLELATGAVAFGGTPTEAALARLTKAPDIPPQLPAELRELLAALTARDPSRRPTARQAATALRGIASTLAARRAAQADIETQYALPVAVSDAAPRSTRRRSAVLVAAGALVVAVALTLGFSLSGGGAPADSADSAHAASAASAGAAQPSTDALSSPDTVVTTPTPAAEPSAVAAADRTPTAPTPTSTATRAAAAASPAHRARTSRHHARHHARHAHRAHKPKRPGKSHHKKAPHPKKPHHAKKPHHHK